jgi:hypothetical protein
MQAALNDYPLNAPEVHGNFACLVNRNGEI